MPQFTSFSLSLLLFLAAVVRCCAQQLQWENHELTFNPAPTDKLVVAHYKFKNTGDAEAKITAINSSCDCATLATEKKNFAPGESGEITATFTMGVRIGQQLKWITVESNDPKNPKTTLRMKAYANGVNS